MEQVREMSYVDIEAMVQVLNEEHEENQRQAQVAAQKGGRR